MTKLNKKQKELMDEWYQKKVEFNEKVMWIGCNPDDKEMMKKQAKEGFKLMAEFHEYSRKITRKIEEVK